VSALRDHEWSVVLRPVVVASTMPAVVTVVVSELEFDDVAGRRVDFDLVVADELDVPDLAAVLELEVGLLDLRRVAVGTERGTGDLNGILGGDRRLAGSGAFR
jgi:hypothetical protein